jgi:CP family cyanate transporter-like MFS transporter
MRDATGLVAAPTESSYRWLMLTLVCFLYFSFGLVSASLAPLLTNIQDDLQVSDALTGVALAAWQFVYIFFAIPAGAAIERLGPRRGLALAGLLIAASQFLRAVAPSYPVLFLGVAIFGLGGPLVSIGAPATVARWFGGRERAIATGLYSVSSAAGNVAALFTANAIFMPLTGDSWRLTLAIFGGFAVMASVLWVVFAKEADFAPGEAGAPRVSALSRFKAVAGIPTVRIMLIMSIGIFMFSHGTSNWLPTLLHRQGLSTADAGALSSLPTIFGLIATLSVTNLIARGKGREFRLLAAIFAAGAVAETLVPLTSGPAQVAVLILLGFGLNGTTAIMMIVLMGMPQVGPRNMGIAGGLWFTFGEVGGVLGPTSVGVMSGLVSLDAGFYMLAVMSAVLLGATFVLQRSAETPSQPSSS